MTAQNRDTLKTKFEQGDTPQGTDYEDLIDSALNVADTSAQSVASAIFTPELQATHASAGSINVTGTVSANAASVAGTVSANTVNVQILQLTDTTAAASAGGGIAVPASADSFAVVEIGGVSYAVPLFRVD